MNNILFSSLLCITVLTFAPACNKKKSQQTTSPSAKITENRQEEIKTTIELDNTIFEIEEDVIDQNTSKF